jgi:hypothetical protein
MDGRGRRADGEVFVFLEIVVVDGIVGVRAEV